MGTKEPRVASRVAVVMTSLLVTLACAAPLAMADTSGGAKANSGERLGFGDTWVRDTDPNDRLGFGDSWTPPRLGFGDDWTRLVGAGSESTRKTQPVGQPSMPNALPIVVAVVALVLGAATVAARVTIARRRRAAVAG
jgi:hypothetical protein